jgi:thioredoxin-related protein
MPAPFTRRRLLLGIACAVLASSAYALGRETPLPTPASLRDAALQAQRQCAPLVLLVSLPGCPWCELLRRNYLTPMRKEGLPAFQIVVNDRQRAVADLQGLPSTGAAIASSYRAQLTPTVLFLDAQGMEVAPRIEGVASADLIGAQLDAALVLARQKVCSK